MTSGFLHPLTTAAASRYSYDHRACALVDADLRVARLLHAGDLSDEAGLILLLHSRLGLALTDAAELLHDAAGNRHACLRLIEQVQAAFLVDTTRVPA